VEQRQPKAVRGKSSFLKQNAAAFSRGVS